MKRTGKGLSVVFVVVALSSTGHLPAEEPAGSAGPTEIAELPDLCLMTTLVDDGQPRCAIVIPDQPHFRTLAERIQTKVRERSGASLPIVDDTESRDVLDRGSAIAIGCLANNKLTERLYLDCFASADRR